MRFDIWPTVHSQRVALAADLGTLSGSEAWETPSLCDGWSVRDTLAHMTATATTTPASFFLGLAGAGFKFSRFAEAGITRTRGTSPQETLANFEAVVGSTKAPPGPKLSWLGEAIIHAEDIRKPLGIRHTYPPEALVAVADFYKNSNTLIGAKRRITGLALHATDTDWHHGNGALVEGPMLALVMAMTGRSDFLDQLSGPGGQALRSRG